MIAAFERHDLSRRWVESQLRATFEPATPPPALNPDDPFAPQERASLALDGVPQPVAPTSAIFVPGWMRGLSGTADVGRFVPGCEAAPYRPTGFLKFQAEARRQSFYGMMSSIACEYGIPVGLFDAMIIRESRYNPASVSPKNAFGLTQLMPGTAAELGVDRYNIVQNLRGGASYLRQHLDRYGQYHLALAAYNAGPGRVRIGGSVPAITETRDYVDDILRNWSRLSGFQRRTLVQTLTSQALMQRAAVGRLATLVTF